MSSPPRRSSNNGSSAADTGDPNPPTYAAFSPSTPGRSSPLNKQRSTILVHQKSPLLVATPPQITRALAYSHPFIVPLNKLVGILSWTTGDPWESFLLTAAFWAVTLYGDFVMRWAGPILLAVVLILGMYTRRYSPLSSTEWTGEKKKGHSRTESEDTRHHKSLDEIVEDLKMFTSRCNILLDPFLRLTDFLSTQRTATSATTRPALTALFIRILMVTPVWIGLALPPFYIITTKRVVLVLGTTFLSWHSRPARVSRTILWRSRLFRRCLSIVTGLEVPEATSRDQPPPLPPRRAKNAHDVAAALAGKRRSASPGIRFTFTLYENQRRWLGIGWTASMLAYERGPWTDEHLNASASKDRFELPEVEGGHARWRWVDGSEWHVEGEKDGDDAWIYYDNKWHDGRRGKDGWGRYTRRRKWYRDAELVEVTPSTDDTPSPTPRAHVSSTSDNNHNTNPPTTPSTAAPPSDIDSTTDAPPDYTSQADGDGSTTAIDNGSVTSSQQRKQRGWFRRPNTASSRGGDAGSQYSGAGSSSSVNLSGPDDHEDRHVPFSQQDVEREWGLGEDARMGFG